MPAALRLEPAPPRTIRHATDSLQLGDHICAVVESHEEILQLGAPYMAAGLARGEQCFYISKETTADEVRAALAKLGVDVAACEARGQLQLVTERETYLRDGDFQPAAMLTFLQDATANALRDHDGARGLGEMSWSAHIPDGFRKLIEYENRVNTLFPAIRFVGFCIYTRSLYPPEVLLEVLRAHPTVAYGGRVYRNFFHVPPEEYLAGRKPETELQRLLENLEARQRLEDDRIQAAERQLELERLREADLLKDQLMGAAAHELGNPLTPLRLQLDLLKADAKPEQRGRIEVMERSVDRMGQLLGDFMAAVRLRQGLRIEDLTQVQSGRIVQDVLDELAPLARSKGLRLQATTEPATFRVDQRKVLQAVYNLVSNAIKYTPEGGHIRIAAAPQDDGVAIRVEDTGMGLQQADLDRLFQSFVRLPGADAAAAGSGLGLYVTRQIAEQHGGFVRAASDGPGKGSRFTLWLPAEPRLDGAKRLTLIQPAQ